MIHHFLLIQRLVERPNLFQSLLFELECDMFPLLVSLGHLLEEWRPIRYCLHVLSLMLLMVTIVLATVTTFDTTTRSLRMAIQYLGYLV